MTPEKRFGGDNVEFLVANDVNVSISRAIAVLEREAKYSGAVCTPGGLPGSD